MSLKTVCVTDNYFPRWKMQLITFVPQAFDWLNAEAPPSPAPYIWVLQPLLSSHSNLLISQLDSKGRSHHILTTCWGHSALSSLCSHVRNMNILWICHGCHVTCYIFSNAVFCFWTGVSGQKVLTQKPTMLSLIKGQKATLDCNIVKDYTVVSWYKQVPGSAPQFVLYFYHSYSSPTYGSGFSPSHFSSTAQSNTDYQLIISNVEAGDSAVYYCGTWDNSPTAAVSQWFTQWQKPLSFLLSEPARNKKWTYCFGLVQKGELTLRSCALTQAKIFQTWHL